MKRKLSLARMSLVMRLSLIVACVLIITGAATGYIIFKSVQHSLSNDLDSHIEARIKWIEASIEVDGDTLEFEPNQAHLDSDVVWKVALQNGRELWSEKWNSSAHKTITHTMTVTLGDPKGNLILSDSLTTVQKTNAFNAYKMPELHGNIPIVISARGSTGPLSAGLQRLTIALWTVGPFSIALLSTILALFIRWQLKPLGEISTKAMEIDPHHVDKRIDTIGDSIEYVRLRDSINAMIDRLALGLGRERQFAFAAAHELRTPIAQLRTNMEVALRKERESADYQQTLNLALADVLRMQELVENLLLFARTQHQSADISVPVDLNRALLEASKRAGVSFELLAPLDGVRAQGNEQLIICALRNVLENAARYAPASAPQVKARQQDGVVLLTFSDSGPGIREADRERIFEPMTRIDDARSISDASGGFGLGLAVARSAIRLCGGDLFCRSRSDSREGAEFVFQLGLAKTTN